MIRHIAVFRWVEGTTPEQVAAITDALRALPAQIPELRAYTVGPDLNLGPDRWDFGVVGDFDDPAGHQAYVEHPAHQAVATGLIAPIRADRATLQIQL